MKKSVKRDLTSYPTKSAIPKPCPSCEGRLERKTVDPQKPLGMVACQNCGFSTTIQDYVQTAKAQVITRAKAKRDQLSQ